MTQAVQFSLFAPTPKIRWGQHHGYTPSRYWLIKGVRSVTQNPQFFGQDAYWFKLGVSKSMGESLKFWCEAFKLIQPRDQQGQYYQPTPFAQALLDEETGDPYLEDIQSLWLLNWVLLEPPCLLPTWVWFFTRFYGTVFTEAHLFEELKEHYAKHQIKVSPNTIAADIKCLLKMYLRPDLPSARRTLEEELMRPFPELGYVSMNPSVSTQEHHYRLNVGKKNGISPALFLYLCIRHIQEEGITCGSTKFHNLMYEPNSPGIILKLSTTGMLGLIDAGLKQIDGLYASTTASINFLQWDKPLPEIERQLWEQLYTKPYVAHYPNQSPNQ